MNIDQIGSIRQLRRMEQESLEQHHKFAAAIEKRIEQIREQRGTQIKEPKFEEHAGNLLLVRKLNDRHATYLSLGRFISGFEDQHSVALGFKYFLDSNQSIKAEWMQVHEKRNRRQLSDNRTPGTTFDLFSVSYNWVWP